MASGGPRDGLQHSNGTKWIAYSAGRLLLSEADLSYNKSLIYAVIICISISIKRKEEKNSQILRLRFVYWKNHGGRTDHCCC